MKILTSCRYLFAHILRDWLRSLLSIFSVAAIICVYLMSSGMINDLQRLGRSLLRFPESLLLVFSRNAIFPEDSFLDLEGLMFYKERIEEAFGEGAVEEVVPFLYKNIRVNGHVVTTPGADYQILKKITRFQLIEGAWPKDDREVIVNQDFVTVLNMGIGDRVNVYGTDLTISGLMDSGIWQNTIVLLDFEQAMAIYNLEDDFQIGGLQLAPWVDPIKAHDAVQSVYKDELCCYVYLHDHYYAITQNAFQGLISLYSVVQVISILLITFGAYNATALVLAEHNREILLTRVIGFSNSQLSWILFARTYLVMIIAFMLGWLGAFVITSLEFSLNPYSMSGVLFTLKFTLFDVLVSFGWMSLCTLLGVLFSALWNDPLKKGSMIRGLSKGRAV